MVKTTYLMLFDASLNFKTGDVRIACPGLSVIDNYPARSVQEQCKKAYAGWRSLRPCLRRIFFNSEFRALRALFVRFYVACGKSAPG